MAQFDFASHFEPFQDVGGDYYDYFYFDDNKFSMVVADDSPWTSALVSHDQRNHALLKQYYFEPDKILAELNNSLIGLIPLNIFITMTFFYI